MKSRSVFLATLLWVALSPASELGQPGKMTFLDNGEVRIGMDLNLGGAVTFISSTDHPSNIINSADLGRQIQMSHYSGPWPYEPKGKKPNNAWAGLGWNPIQTGDCYMNPSRVLTWTNTGKEIYIKCRPMQWPHDNVPGDCIFETWTSLNGPLIRIRFRCTNQREDKTFYRPCPQELPAVYTISKLHRLMSYTGDRPFIGGKMTHVTNDWHKPWPWTRFLASEGWAALVDDSGWGLGVFKTDGCEFHGGIHGEGRSDDPKHASTSYVAPIHVENFDQNIVYEHETFFMVGKLEAIRSRFNALASKSPPSWVFSQNRQHWTLKNARDQGFPWPGQWTISFSPKKPWLQSPVLCWRAESAPKLKLDVLLKGESMKARIYWRSLGSDSFDKMRSVELSLTPDGKFQRYEVSLADSAEYKGMITGLAIELDSGGGQNEFAVRAIGF